MTSPVRRSARRAARSESRTAAASQALIAGIGRQSKWSLRVTDEFCIRNGTSAGIRHAMCCRRLRCGLGPAMVGADASALRIGLGERRRCRLADRRDVDDDHRPNAPGWRSASAIAVLPPMLWPITAGRSSAQLRDQLQHVVGHLDVAHRVGPRRGAVVAQVDAVHRVRGAPARARCRASCRSSRTARAAPPAAVRCRCSRKSGSGPPRPSSTSSSSAAGR